MLVHNTLSGFCTACMVFAPEADEEGAFRSALAGHDCSISGDCKYSCKAQHTFVPSTYPPSPLNSPLGCTSNSIGMATSSAGQGKLYS